MDTQVLTSAALALLLGYALGSIPFGVVLTRLGGAGDLRNVGSGNIGATNVLRTGRKGLAAATLALDALKGAAAVWIAQSLWPPFTPFAATGAFFGHLYPLWLRFNGGKGVATMLGIVAAMHWPSGLAFVLIWLGALAATRYSSVGGMAAAASAPVAAAVAGRFDLALLFFGIALLGIWKHRGNLERLLAGTEPAVRAMERPTGG
jgi:glycerol-3-phosphate acyltransferase PlsY